MEDKKQSGLVKKSNRLVEASYRLGLNEQRVLALAISKIEVGEKELRVIRLQVSELMGMIGSRSRNIDILQAATENLVSRVLHIRRNGEYCQVSWLYSATYHSDKTVSLKFAEELRADLLQLRERFTAYGIKNIVQLRSRHSVRFYELIKQREWEGVWEVDLVKLRNMLGLLQKEYPEWQDFKRRVLETARNELKEKTDVQFKYKTILTKRKVTGLKVTISSRRETYGKAAKQAKVCYEATQGVDCEGKWTKDKKTKCHWCTKYAQTRIEEAGQQVLFPKQEGTE